ncbi:MAG: NAD(P)H-binding protein [Methylotenera sp.]|nr:NAD(P)H-binding protein [Oligoflexia bacterium]
MKAILLGATGLVGSEVLKALVSSPACEEVRALVRNPLLISHPKLNQVVVDFDCIHDFSTQFTGYDTVFNCLGTTLRKAGSQQAFRQVDYTYPLETAKIARTEGAQNFLFVSSVGADPQSGNFYLKTKGQLEESLRQLKFPETHCFRPSLLLGERTESQALEKLFIAVASSLAPLIHTFFRGPLQKYQPVQATKVAQAMVNAALSSPDSPHTGGAVNAHSEFYIHECLRWYGRMNGRIQC